MASGLNIGYWSPDCEAWFQSRARTISDGTSTIKNAHVWSQAMKFEKPRVLILLWFTRSVTSFSHTYSTSDSSFSCLLHLWLIILTLAPLLTHCSHACSTSDSSFSCLLHFWLIVLTLAPLLTHHSHACSTSDSSFSHLLHLWLIEPLLYFYYIYG